MNWKSTFELEPVICLVCGEEEKKCKCELEILEDEEEVKKIKNTKRMDIYDPFENVNFE